MDREAKKDIMGYIREVDAAFTLDDISSNIETIEKDEIENVLEILEENGFISADYYRTNNSPTQLIERYYPTHKIMEYTIESILDSIERNRP